MGGLFRSIAWAATAIALLAPAESLETRGIRERTWCSHGRFLPALGFATSTSVRVLGAAGRVCRRGSICGHVPHGRLGRPRLLGLRAQVDPRLPPDDAAAQQDPDAEQSGGIDWDAVGMQWKLFQKMALPYFEEEKSSRVLLFIVICFTLLNSWVSVGFSFLSRDFWSALNTKDADAFYPTLGKFAVALTGGAPIAVLYRFYREKLSLQWRAWMTLRILDMWEANRSYYDLEMSGLKILTSPLCSDFVCSIY